MADKKPDRTPKLNSRFEERLAAFMIRVHLVHLAPSRVRPHRVITVNQCVVANAVANLIGFILVHRIVFWGALNMYPENRGSLNWGLEHGLPVVAALIGIGCTLVYERPVRRLVADVFDGRPIPESPDHPARRRLLNEPFLVAGMNLGLWIIAGLIYSLAAYFDGESLAVAVVPAVASLNTGLIVATIAFFMVEHIVQWHLAPLLYPQGGLTRTRGTVRLRILVRLGLLLLALNIIPLLSINQLLAVLPKVNPTVGTDLGGLRRVLLANSLMFSGLGLLLCLLVGMNMSLPFQEIIRVLQAVRRGCFDQRVTVTSNDEIGFTGDVINEMTRGLEERERLRRSMILAREVQQALMPKAPPVVPGLDLAGRAVYSEETGGDYFDHFYLAGDDRRIGLAVADVSDHGLQSALLMIAFRGYLRHHAEHMSDLLHIADDINDHLVNDVGETGRFITMFLAVVDMEARRLSWVRAGHDPGFLYDPAAGDWVDLRGPGLALGVAESGMYKVRHLPMRPGQILVMGTDGIWESRSPDGAFYGKKRLRAVVAANADQPAARIVERVFASVEEFSRRPLGADDQTLLVAKWTE